MIEILDWVFTSFWRFAGVIILMLSFFEGVGYVVKAFRAHSTEEA